MKTAIACGLACVVLTTAPVAQAPPTGTAQVSGTVVSLDATPVPVRRAIVTLRDGLVSRSAISDDRGQFVFRALPAGRYSLTAQKAAWVTATYGARRPGRAGTPLSVAAGQTIADVTLYMTRGAAISGTVRDPFGRPVPRIDVIVRPAGVPIQPMFPGRDGGQLTTDDRGVYRAYGLEPGSYVVAAVPFLTYGSTEMRAMTASEMDAALRELQTRQTRVPSAPPAAAPDAGVRRMWVPVFHPGVTTQPEATPVVVKAGDDISGIDIPLMLVSAVNIEGTIVRPDGAPVAGTQVIISGVGGAMPVALGSAPILATQPRADGKFKYVSVAPGQYTITARSSDGLFAVSQLMVGTDDLAGVTLALQPGLTFSGIVRFDGVSQKRPASLASTRLTLAAPGSSGGGVAVANNTYIGIRPNAAANLSEDGTFTIPNVLPGLYTLIAPTHSGWWLRSVIANGRDLLDEPMNIDRSVSDTVVLYTDLRTEVTGVLQTPAGIPAVEYFVLVFSANRQHWFAGSRRTRTARPASDGRYVFMDLPPGDYFLAALEDVEAKQLGDPAFLAQAQPAAVRVSLSEGGKAQLDLKIAREVRTPTGSGRSPASPSAASSARSHGGR